MLLKDILWPESSFCMVTLGPQHLIHGYLVPLDFFWPKDCSNCRGLLDPRADPQSRQPLAVEERSLNYQDIHSYTYIYICIE